MQLRSWLSLRCLQTTVQVAAQQKAPVEQITDLPADSAQKDAITRIVSQGIMAPLSAGTFAPQSPTTLRQFAVSMQHLFQLPRVTGGQKFIDVPASDLDFAALTSFVPYLERQAFCPGCALNDSLRPDNSISSAAEAVAITSILIERRRITLVTNPVTT
jgi:S-layer homology domain